MAGEDRSTVFDIPENLHQVIGENYLPTPIKGVDFDVITPNYQYDYMTENIDYINNISPNVCVEFYILQEGMENIYGRFYFNSANIDLKKNVQEVFKVSFEKEVTIRSVRLYHLIEVIHNPSFQSGNITTIQKVTPAVNKIN